MRQNVCFKNAENSFIFDMGPFAMTASPESDLISSQSSSKGRVILYLDLTPSYAEKSFLLAVEDLETRLRSGRMEAGSFSLRTTGNRA